MKNLKVYYFEFDALWMGGNAIVVAGDELDAQFLLEDRFKERFRDKELKIWKVEDGLLYVDIEFKEPEKPKLNIKYREQFL